MKTKLFLGNVSIVPNEIDVHYRVHCVCLLLKITCKNKINQFILTVITYLWLLKLESRLDGLLQFRISEITNQKLFRIARPIAMQFRLQMK